MYTRTQFYNSIGFAVTLNSELYFSVSWYEKVDQYWFTHWHYMTVQVWEYNKQGL